MKLLQSLVNLVNPHLVRVEKAESYSGAEVTGVGIVNSFLTGNNLFRSLTKKSRAKSEGNITEYCNGEMPSSKPMPRGCVSMCTAKTIQLWFTESDPSAVTH